LDQQPNKAVLQHGVAEKYTETNMRIVRSLYVSAVVAAAACATLEIPAEAAQTINVAVGEVSDNRTTGAFFSECKLELKFTGDAASDAAAVRRVRVKKAIDELGRDLSRSDSEESFHSFNSGQRNGVLKTELRLRNPSRNAGTIKIVDGEVELFSPTAANGGVLTIKDILKHPAEPVQTEALKKYGVELIYLTKESYEAKKKQIQDQKKSDADGKLGEAFGELFKGMFGGMMASDSKNSVKLYVKDPEKRVVDVEFQDASGNALKTGNSWSMGELRQIEFKSAPPADTQLLIHLATPEALQTFAFKVENVPLP
jgi:hypothetical protein